MKKIPLLLVSAYLFIFTGCKKDDPAEPEIITPDVVLNNEVNEFIWKGMNSWYLWQSEVSVLADNNFADNNEFYTYLNGFTESRTLFSNLQTTKDRFSAIVSDYDILFNSFAGVAKTSGVEYTLVRPPEGGNRVIGVVRYIINGSDASSKDIKRGDIFYAVNGTELFAETDATGSITNSNLDLLNADSYTLNLSTIENNVTTPNGVNVPLTQQELTENPILISKVIETNGKKVGYIMYNSFTSNFDSQLNDAFLTFKNANIDELVVDLRYNRGGSVQSSIRLGSMITGQFTGQLFSREKWNDKWQALFSSDNNFTNTVNNAVLNSLGMTRVFIIATDDSASASELLINSLKPYIEVVHVGDVTVGKNEFSVTLVDNPGQQAELTNGSFISLPYIVFNDNSIADANRNHKYAMQPLVGTNENADGFSEFTTGLVPDIEIPESLINLGELGNPTEPLLAAALDRINGTTGKSYLLTTPKNLQIKTITSSNKMKPFRDVMLQDTKKIFK
ncbi:S41 family peptidase [Cellulophaga tyrosinoxydans]|uniref:C-terminal processing protease CtpA/Prc, contains a PDZ domain n=1 Tax=Cellulophaga tyrosinoxydans TaxID=504486 RepID=A0A1W2CLU9_9FLAO|nr:S41 family peptidase [Cellulophaga tyrosinoxydans]SMC86189.1 C-terminal processing protease CtpA/Prc, contains a PDZ domain [Cellulophaga tyrosinoxydans]